MLIRCGTDLVLLFQLIHFPTDPPETYKGLASHVPIPSPPFYVNNPQGPGDDLSVMF
jgi:hypothetical protein